MDSIIDLTITLKPFLYILHAIGFALGLGGASINDFLFFRFLKDLKISAFESSILNAMSKAIWVGLIILMLSGAAIYLTDIERFNETPKFWAKMTVVLVIFLNGIALNLFVAPKLRKISFVKAHDHVTGELRLFRRIAFGLGAVSMVSWYSALVLGSLRSLPFGYLEIIFGYSVVLSGAVLSSQIVEYVLSKRKLHF